MVFAATTLLSLTSLPFTPPLKISLSCVNNFLDEMAKEAKQIITNICVEQCDLSHQLRPKNCAAEIAQQVNKRRRENRPGRGRREDVVCVTLLVLRCRLYFCFFFLRLFAGFLSRI